MLPVLATLMSAAFGAGPTDSALPWYRQTEGSIGLGSAANSHSDRLSGVARVGAGWRWNEHVGIEIVTTASPDLVAFTPAMTLRPLLGPVQPVVSAGFGLGVTTDIDGCGGPFDRTKGCGWTDQAAPFEAAYVKSVTRGSLGTRVNVDPVWVTPQLDAQLLDLDTATGWELGFTVSVGLQHEQDTAPEWVVRTQNRLQEQRLERVERTFYSDDRDVAIDAWHIVMDEYRRVESGPLRATYEAFVVDALETGRFSRREAADVYRVHGRELTVLEPALHARVMDCLAARRAIRVVAARTGQEVEAQALLERASATASCDVGE